MGNCDFLQYDLNQRPWPWEDESCEAIVMKDCLEHLNGGTFIEVMEEIWRVLKVGGQVAIQVPDATYPTVAFADPTHQMFFTEHSMDYLDPHTNLGYLMFHYTPKKFVLVKAEAVNNQLHFVLRKIACNPCEVLIVDG